MRRLREEVASGRRLGRRRALQQREEASVQLSRILDLAPIGMAIVGLDGRFLRVNQALLRIVGYEDEELRLLRFEDITHPDDRHAHDAFVRRLLAGEIRLFRLPKRYLRKDGSMIEVMVHVTLIRDAGGRPLHYVSQIEDVTGRRRAERALAESERRHRALFESAMDAIVVLDVVGRVLDANPAAMRLLGASGIEQLARRLVSFGDGAPPLLVHGERHGELELSLPDGRQATVEYAARAHFLPGRHLVTARDVTERRRVEAELRRSRELLERAQAVAHFGSWEYLLESGVVLWSKSCREIFGWELERPPRVEEYFARIHPDDCHRLRATVLELLRRGRTFETSHRIVRPDGTVRFVECNGEVYRSAAGRPLRVLGVVQDITERRRAEAEREELLARVAEERGWLVTAIEHSPTAVILVGVEDGDRFVANARAAELLGEPLDPARGMRQWIGRLATASGEPLSYEQLPAVRARRYGEVTHGVELRLLRRDGGEVPILLSAAPVRDDRGHVQGAVVIWEDISVLKELERQRQEWTALVAHDLRQPLTTIVGYAGMAKRAGGRGMPERAEHILASAKRLDRLIQDLIDVSRLESRRLVLAKERVGVRAALEAAVQRLSHDVPDHEVRLSCAEGLPDVELDPVRFEQVLGNLISNAAKYGTPASPIDVEAAAREGAVEIAVTNRGAGIAPEDLPRVFGRYFRSGEARRSAVPGLGLGLFISRGLVEAHGGTISVESEPGARTTFRVRLPALPP